MMSSIMPIKTDLNMAREAAAGSLAGALTELRPARRLAVSNLPAFVSRT